jgi:hypothetical protein
MKKIVIVQCYGCPLSRLRFAVQSSFVIFGGAFGAVSVTKQLREAPPSMTNDN